MKKSIPWLATWMTTLGQAAITLYIPAFPQISQDLHIDPTEVKSTLTIFLLGFGLSQLFYGPLSDRYGRKILLLSGIAFFSLTCLATLFVHSLSLFNLLRLLQGIGSGAVITIGRSILRDSFNGKELAQAASHLSMGFAIGLGISPVIGAFLLTYFGWRSNFLFLSFLGAFLFILLAKKLPETSPKSIHSGTTLEALHTTLKRYFGIIKDFNFWKFLLGGTSAYSVVIAWNVLTPFLIQVHFGYSADAYGLMSLLIAIAYYLAAHYNRSLVMKFHLGKIFLVGTILIAFSGLLILLLPSSLLAAMTIATFGQALIFSNTIACALHNYPHIPGVASAMFSSLQMLLASSVSGALALLPDQTLTLGLVLIILGIVAFSFLLSQFKKE